MKLSEEPKGMPPEHMAIMLWCRATNRYLLASVRDPNRNSDKTPYPPHLAIVANEDDHRLTAWRFAFATGNETPYSNVRFENARVLVTDAAQVPSPAIHDTFCLCMLSHEANFSWTTLGRYLCPQHGVGMAPKLSQFDLLRRWFRGHEGNSPNQGLVFKVMARIESEDQPDSPETLARMMAGIRRGEADPCPPATPDMEEVRVWLRGAAKRMTRAELEAIYVDVRTAEMKAKADAVRMFAALRDAEPDPLDWKRSDGGDRWDAVLSRGYRLAVWECSNGWTWEVFSPADPDRPEAIGKEDCRVGAQQKAEDVAKEMMNV